MNLGINYNYIYELNFKTLNKKEKFDFLAKHFLRQSSSIFIASKKWNSYEKVAGLHLAIFIALPSNEMAQIW